MRPNLHGNEMVSARLIAQRRDRREVLANLILHPGLVCERGKQRKVGKYQGKKMGARRKEKNKRKEEMENREGK